MTRNKADFVGAAYLLAASFVFGFSATGAIASQPPGAAPVTESVTAAPEEPRIRHGERLEAHLLGPSMIEPAHAAVERDRAQAAGETIEPGGRNHAHGSWIVPPDRATYYPHSGDRYVINNWGDVRMGIGFPGLVDVHGAFFAGQGNRGAWTAAVRAVGYREGEVVEVTDWMRDIGRTPRWLDMSMSQVDRIVIEAQPVHDGGGWYAMDDLVYVAASPRDGTSPAITVLDFEDCDSRQVLTGSAYAGLNWETGTGDFGQPDFIHPPYEPPGDEAEVDGADQDGAGLRGGLGTLPELEDDFQAVVYDEAPGATSFPPDTCGAVGPHHYVVIVNRNISMYDKAPPYTRRVSASLPSFQLGSGGDPRILFDQHSGRWIALATDFDTRIYLGVSLTDDPTGGWFKTSFVASAGSDSGAWPDFPTLGVDENGIYTSAAMIGASMTIFAIDKAPLLASPPSLGTITAFRGLPSVGSIQPVHTYGSAAGEYFISRTDSTHLRIRRINPPLTSPTLQTIGNPSIPSHSSPPDAPALESAINLDTGGTRIWHTPPYRDGFIWAAHTVDSGGRSAIRWYKVDVSPLSVVESGTISDSSLYFFYPHIMVNARGDAVVGFSGSNADQYAGAYYTGRRSDDPAGETAVAFQYRAGASRYQRIDSYGRNRWGDYSATTLDPADQLTFWTIQEYVHAANTWGTHVAKLSYGDCNNNGVEDAQDIIAGTSADCNMDQIPDECQLYDNDCDGDLVPDDCQTAALIADDPADTGDCPGGTVSLSVSATAPGATFQWRKDGAALADGGGVSGATTDTVIIESLDSSDGGVYTCVVADGCLEAESEPATLTVAEPAAVSTQPEPLKLRCTAQTATFAVGVAGTGPVEYQWSRNGAPLSDGGRVSGAQSATLQIADITTADDGRYRCFVANLCGSDESDPSVLHIVNAVFLADPQSACAAVGDTAIFTAEAAAPPPQTIGWRWKRNGELIVDGGDVSGSLTDTLTISNVSAEDAGTYSALVYTFDPVCLTDSNDASLTVGDCDVCLTPGDLDGDGDYDLVDVQGFTACFGADVRADPGCLCANVDDSNETVDLGDWAALGSFIGGPH